MTAFSNDADILKFEPILFVELYLPSQVLAEGSGGTLNGTSFGASGGDFLSSQISAGCVLYLQSADKTLDCVYEIVSVDSETQLSVSVIRADSDDLPIAPPGAEDVSYRISTFMPQANQVGFELTQYFGIRPGNPASPYDVDDILDTNVLRQASVYAVISAVYSMLAGNSENENFRAKSLHYQQLYTKAKSRCRLCIDIDSDENVDISRIGSSARLVRD
ncbi:hypothetical protein ACFLZ8_01570 [Planctomycetota bacterium]